MQGSNFYWRYDGERIEATLYKLSEVEESEYKYVQLGRFERLFRYETELMRQSSVYGPHLIKINLKTGRVYHLKNGGINSHDLFGKKGWPGKITGDILEPISHV